MRSESKNALSAVLFTEGLVVGQCWEKLKPQGPKGGSRSPAAQDAAPPAPPAPPAAMMDMLSMDDEPAAKPHPKPQVDLSPKP